MLVLPANNVPDDQKGKVSRNISAYQTRISQTVVTTIVVFLGTLGVLILPVGWIGVEIVVAGLLFMGIFGFLVNWVIPTRRYNADVAAKRVVFVDSAALNHFRRQAFTIIEQRASAAKDSINPTVIDLWQQGATQADIDQALTKLLRQLGEPITPKETS